MRTNLLLQAQSTLPRVVVITTTDVVRVAAIVRIGGWCYRSDPRPSLRWERSSQEEKPRINWCNAH